MKCKNYSRNSHLCLNCDFPTKIQCSKEFDFETPKKYINMASKDMAKFTWNECPSCGCSIGYHPSNKNFRCPKCNQKILWD